MTEGTDRQQRHGGIALNAAIAVSFMLALALDSDWWAMFGYAMGAIAVLRGIRDWFTAPEKPLPDAPFAGGPTIVPREAKLGLVTAAGVIGLVMLAVWLA